MTNQSRKTTFTAKQYIVILLAQPLNQEYNPHCHPSRKGLRNALHSYFGIDRTMQHVNRLLVQLQVERIIEKETITFHTWPGSLPIPCKWFRVVNLNKVFEEHLSLIESSRKVLARERRRRKAKDAQARGLK